MILTKNFWQHPKFDLLSQQRLPQPHGSPARPSPRSSPLTVQTNRDLWIVSPLHTSFLHVSPPLNLLRSTKHDSMHLPHPRRRHPGWPHSVKLLSQKAASQSHPAPRPPTPAFTQILSAPRNSPLSTRETPKQFPKHNFLVFYTSMYLLPLATCWRCPTPWVCTSLRLVSSAVVLRKEHAGHCFQDRLTNSPSDHPSGQLTHPVNPHPPLDDTGSLLYFLL